MKKGKVWLVGAGPGDKELITVKGQRCLREADVVFYDHLASKELLDLVRKDAQVVCVGKSDGLHLMEQGRINRLLFASAKAGRTVVRLKGGDPMVFSRGIEEALFLKKKGIDLEIVPGITSAFAAPESFGIPLTRRGLYSSVAVLTGRKSNGEKLDAPACDTLVYLMAVGHVKEVVKVLLASGRGKRTPCAFVERGTTRHQRIVTGTLANIVDRAKGARVRPPAVLIVGEVVGYGPRVYVKKYRST